MRSFPWKKAFKKDIFSFCQFDFNLFFKLKLLSIVALCMFSLLKFLIIEIFSSEDFSVIAHFSSVGERIINRILTWDANSERVSSRSVTYHLLRTEPSFSPSSDFRRAIFTEEKQKVFCCFFCAFCLSFV